MATQSRSRKKREDHIRFAATIRVSVPGDGFGPKLDKMYQWLDARLGRFNYAIHSDTIPGRRDLVIIYADEPYPLHELLAEFQLELVGRDSTPREREYRGWAREK